MARKLIVMLAVALWLPSTGYASAILINGSFESGPSGGGFDLDVLAGSTDITGWTVFGAAPLGNGVIDFLNAPWDVSDGLHAIDLDGRDSVGGGVSQSFSTTTGGSYLLSFDLSGNPGGGPVTKQMRVSVSGVMHDYAFDTSGLIREDLTWQRVVLPFVAQGPLTVLSFTSLTGVANSYGALIDNVTVSVSAVPEPSSLALLSMPAVALIIRRRLRSSASADTEGACGINDCHRQLQDSRDK